MDDLLTVGSLFSGIGGIDLGLERTGGFRTRWFAEVEPYCSRVPARHWPDVPNLGDVREIGADAPTVDVLAGGFPCQPVSLAGRRQGQSDARWLWPEFARLVGLLRPRVVLVENVPGLASKGLGAVLEDLSALGYDAEWNLVSAAAVGAPHLRERLFVVAYPESGGDPHVTTGSNGSALTVGSFTGSGDRTARWDPAEGDHELGRGSGVVGAALADADGMAGRGATALRLPHGDGRRASRSSWARPSTCRTVAR